MELGSSALGQTKEQAQNEQGKTGQQEQPTHEFSTALPVKIVEDQAATDARKASEAEARDREVADLAAQEGMNAATQSIEQATRDMRDYSLYSTIAVCIGTLLLLVTLWLTRQATNAATKAVDVTEKIGRDQSRAYVHVESAELTWGGSKAQNPGIYLTVENVGQTPARWFEVVTRVVVEPLDERGRITEDIKFSEIDFSGRNYKRWASLPHKRSCPAVNESDLAMLTDAYQKSVSVTVFGIIRYETFFGEIFETQFCYFRKRAPSYEHEVVKEDVIKSGSGEIKVTEKNRIVREIGHKMSAASMDVKAYERVG